MSKPALIRLRWRFRFFRHHHFTPATCPTSFAEVDAVFVSVAPQMERVGENYITHHAAQIVVTEIDRWIELEIPCDIAGETDRR